MMRFFLCLYVTLFSAHFTTLAQSVRIDDAEATIRFVFEDDDVDGSLSDFKFTGAITLSNLGSSNISGSVSTESLDTDNWLRNKILRGKKYFNAKDHPRISFASTAVAGSENEFMVTGNLTIKGITKQVRFTFKRAGSSFLGSARINAAHWDIRIHEKEERNMVKIAIHLPFFPN